MLEEEIVRELLVDGLDDWVPVDDAIWSAREFEEPGGHTFKEIFRVVIENLLVNRLMIVGDIGDDGFAPWKGGVDDVMGDLLRKLDEVDWYPRGGVAWLANTEKGDIEASKYVGDV